MKRYLVRNFLTKILYAAIFIALCSNSHAIALEKFIEIQSEGRGSNYTQAIQNALDEALRKNMGTLFLSREELNNESLIDKVIQVSRGGVKNSQVLTEISRANQIILTVKFLIDTDTVKEYIQNVREGFSGSVDVRTRPLIERGKSLIRSFFEGYNPLEFLEVKASDIMMDPNKSEFYTTIRLTMNRAKYLSHFAEPFAAILDEVILNDEFEAEIFDEPPERKHAALIYILGKNMTFKAWTLPAALFDELVNSAGFENYGDKILLQTQKRMWVNIRLIDKTGHEIDFHRIPVSIPVTNIIFFQSHKLSAPLGMRENTANSLSIMCGPFLGISEVNGRRYQSIYSDDNDPLEYKFVIRLPYETITKINSASVWLQSEI